MWSGLAKGTPTANAVAHDAILSQLPAEAISIDVGRAVGGDFVRIIVAGEYVDRFR